MCSIAIRPAIAPRAVVAQRCVYDVWTSSGTRILMCRLFSARFLATRQSRNIGENAYKWS